MPEQTFTPGGAAPAPSSDAARSKVTPPAICLIVTAGLGMALQVVSLLINLLGAGLGAAGGREGIPAALSGGIGAAINVISIIGGVVVLMGALKMKNLKSHGFALAASIIAMIPFISPCCLLGLPFGIWALVVLLKPEVKSAFTN